MKPNRPPEKAAPTPKRDEFADGPDSNLRKFGLVSVIIGELFGYTAVGVGLGYVAWSKWHAPIWVLVLTSMASLGLAFYRLTQILRKEW